MLAHGSECPRPGRGLSALQLLCSRPEVIQPSADALPGGRVLERVAARCQTPAQECPVAFGDADASALEDRRYHFGLQVLRSNTALLVSDILAWITAPVVAGPPAVR